MQNAKSLPHEPIAGHSSALQHARNNSSSYLLLLGLEMTLLVAFTGVPVHTITSVVTLLQYHRSTEKQLYIFSGPVEHEVGGTPVQKSGRKKLAKVQKCRTGSLSWTSEGLALLLH